MSENNEEKTNQESWVQIQSNLKAALCAWEDLSRQPAGRSQHDQQLEDMKRLLVEINKQLKAWSL